MMGSQLDINMLSANNAAFQMQIQTVCGLWSGYYIFQTTGQSLSLSASPNPATSTINVTVGESEDVSGNTATSLSSTAKTKTASTLSTTAKQNNSSTATSSVSGVTNMYLYDFYTNQLIKKWSYQESSSSTYNLNVAEVKRGIYILKMERNNVSSVTKVILQ